MLSLRRKSEQNDLSPMEADLAPKGRGVARLHRQPIWRAGGRLTDLPQWSGSAAALGFLDGDLVVVRQQQDAYDGDIVVALVDDETATIKKLQRQDGQIRLLAMNPAHPPLTVAGERVRIQGRVIGVRRDLRPADER